MKSILEIATPLKREIEEFVSELAGLARFDTIVLEESGGPSATLVAELLKQRCEKRIFLKIACRDRNRIALHSQLLTAAGRGFCDLVLVDGVHPTRTPFAAAKPVYELDALTLLRMLKQGSPVFGDEIDSSLTSVSWTIGVRIGGATSADIARVEKFLAAGADMFFVPSGECVSRIKSLTDKPIFLSVAQEASNDIEMALREAESAGADGASLMAGSQSKATDGSIVA